MNPFRGARSRSAASRNSQPRGVAVVELAVCLPIVVLITFATVEACQMLHVRQTLKVTAFEAARIGAIPNATSGNVRGQTQALLNDQRIVDFEIRLTPSDPKNLRDGDPLEVTLSASAGSNALLGNWFYQDREISQTVSILAHR